MIKRMLSVSIGMIISTAQGKHCVEEIIKINKETRDGIVKERKIVLRDENGLLWSMNLEDQSCKSLVMSICGELSELPAEIVGHIENAGSKIKKGWSNLVTKGKAHCASFSSAN